MAKADYANYNQGDEIVKIDVCGTKGNRIDTFRVNRKDKKRQKQIGDYLYEKYEVDLGPDKSPAPKDNFFDF